MPDRLLVIACGALAREIRDLRQVYGWDHIHLRCLDPLLHNRPERIADELRKAIVRHRDKYDQIFVGYADCGTSGAIDNVLAEFGINRLPGAHCYEFYARPARFRALSDADPGSFYLTDFLVRNFNRLVVQPLRLDELPEHISVYFSNYSRVVYLSQSPDQQLLAAARAAASRLGLAFEHEHCGYGDLQASLSYVVSGRENGQDHTNILA